MDTKFQAEEKILTPLSNSLPRREDNYPLLGRGSSTEVGRHCHADNLCWGKPSSLTPLPKVQGNNLFASQTDTCHAELVSASCNSHGDKTLKRVQGDKVAFTLAEVLFHPAEQSKRTASRIILVVAGVTSRSNTRAGALRATAPYRKFGFTLAEVLITLGIIGIVAALTMPTLIQHHRKQEASARLKKFYSMMNQAVMLSTIDNGHPNTWFRMSEDRSPDKSQTDKMLINGNSAYTFFMKYLSPYMKYVSIDKFEMEENPDDLKKYESKVVLADSSTVYFHNGDCLDMKFDYNGSKPPNKQGQDTFVFTLCHRAYFAKLLNGNENIVFSAYLKVNAPNRQKALEKCKTNTNYCSTLLLYDNWEFKDDYPYKL